ncbi:MAG: LysR family transcriptional regulator [Opitutaceae bacterium]|jgi:LysR family transcriptional activator of nhaA
MDWLNYHHLLYFWTVAKEGGLRKAAEKLHISQPSISTQIRQLEEALGEKLFSRRGRSRVLTPTGQLAFDYADSIFSLGAEFLNAVKEHTPSRQRAIRLTIGVEDSFPKHLSYEILKPVMGLNSPVHLVCKEGKSEDLLAQLAIHRLDAVLTDEPATASFKARVFNHLLGESSVAIYATGKLARVLHKGFPKSLDGAPALLPTSNTTLRRALDEWFHAIGVQPRVIAEFEDGALMKIAAAYGHGFIPVPSVAMNEGIARFGLVRVGKTTRCADRFFLVTGDRRTVHPAVMLITEHAQSLVFS